MISDIEKIFDLKLDDTFGKKPDVLNYLKNHERKNIVLENLSEQIKGCERANYSINFDVKKYHYTIDEIALFFARNALRYAEEQAVSRIERQRRIDEANKIEDAKEMMQELEDEALTTKIVSRPGAVAN
jgi:hypothetical protein